MTSQTNTSISKKGLIIPFIFVLLISVGFFQLNLSTIKRVGLTSSEIPILHAITPELYLDFPGYAGSVQNQGIINPLIVSQFARFFENDNIILRLPSLIFATLCIPLLFILLIKYLPRGAAFLSIIFFVLSPSFHLFATDGRGYSLFLFASLILYLIAIKIVTQRTLLNKLLIFGASLVLFDASFFAFLANFAAIFFLFSVQKKEVLTDDHEVALLKSTIGFLLYSTAAFAVINIIYGNIFYSTSTWPPPSSFTGSNFGMKDWVLMTYIGSYAGFEKNNAFLAFASVPLLLYGAMLLRKHFRYSFSTLAPASCVILLIAAFYFSSGTIVTSYETFTNQIGYALTVLTPFISVFIACSFYYLFTSLSKTSALSIYTPFKLVKVILSVLIVISFGGMFAIASYQNLRNVTTHERENWKTVATYIKNNGKDGDILNIYWRSGEAASYYLSSLFSKSSISDENRDVTSDEHSHEQTGSWIVFSSPPKKFGHAENTVIKADVPLNTRVYEGSFGTVTLLGNKFPIVSKSTTMRVSYTEMQASKTMHLSAESAHSAFCSRTEPCIIKLFLLNEGTYEFVLPPLLSHGKSDENMKICGFNAHDLKSKIVGSMYTGNFKSGECEIFLPAPDDIQLRSFDIMIRNADTIKEEIFYQERLSLK